MIILLALVFLLPFSLIAAYVFLLVTRRLRYFVVVVGIALIEYIVWLYLAMHQVQSAPAGNGSSFASALFPTLAFVSVIMFALYALRRGQSPRLSA